MTVAPFPSGAENVVESGLLDGRVRLRQPVKGYRAGMDAALLAAAVPASTGERVIEAGCGVGAVMTQIAARRPGVGLIGLERDPVAAELARGNLGLNGIDGLIRQGDVAAGFPVLGLDRCDWAISNPPYFDNVGALRAPSPEKRGAWMADDGLAAWTSFLLKAVRDGGRVVVIHRAERLADLLSGLGKTAGSFAVRPIHPFADEPAKRVLVHAIKSGRGPLRLLPPLVLHDRTTGQHTDAAQAILRGRASLDW